MVQISLCLWALAGGSMASNRSDLATLHTVKSSASPPADIVSHAGCCNEISLFFSGRYSAPFREKLHSWIVSLSTVSDIVEQWVAVQNLWIYMEAVFSSGDIAKQLPQEAKRFTVIITLTKTLNPKP